VIPASVDDVPTMTETCKSPYGELSLASDDVACEVPGQDSKRPYGELSLASDDVACEVPRQDGKRPYGEPSLFNDIEHDGSRMSGSELRQTRQYLEHGSTYSHLQEGAVKTCLEHCSTLNYTERDSVRKCLIARKALGDEEDTPSTAGSATSKNNCMFVEDPIDAWVQNDHTRGAYRFTPFTHPTFVEDTADPEHTPEVVGILNGGLNKLAKSLTWENWALKSGHYPSASENLPPSEANTLEEADDDDGELPQGSLKDLTRAAMLKMPHGQRRKFLIAESKELKAIEDLRVIEGMVPIPKGVRPIGTRFVYATKDPVAQEGKKTERMAKARLTMKDIKRGGDNLRETFAPTGQTATFRWLMMIALVLHLYCDHVDVNTVFLYATLTHPMFITGAPGRLCPMGYCLKVVKALYGCREAPREWYHCNGIYTVLTGSMPIYPISWPTNDPAYLLLCGRYPCVLC
jgi:hypothetical protein